MSIETVTLDGFMRLGIDEHKEALEQYDASITNLAGDLTRLTPDTEQHIALLDKLCRHATLRKVHRGCLQEMEESLAQRQQPWSGERGSFSRPDELPA
ncbi:MAG: hypothetical protein ACRYFX_19735 [Janthinobacterium lividum]